MQALTHAIENINNNNNNNRNALAELENGERQGRRLNN